MRCERSSRGRFLGVRLMDGAASSETYSKNLNTSYLQEVFKVVEIRVVEIDRDQVLRCTLTSHPREVSGVMFAYCNTAVGARGSLGPFVVA